MSLSACDIQAFAAASGITTPMSFAKRFAASLSLYWLTTSFANIVNPLNSLVCTIDPAKSGIDAKAANGSRVTRLIACT